MNVICAVCAVYYIYLTKRMSKVIIILNQDVFYGCELNIT